MHTIIASSRSVRSRFANATRRLVATPVLLLVALAACRTSSVNPPAPVAATTSSSVAGRPLHVLFLGHKSEHHNSAAYEPLLASTLMRRGIQISYEDDPAQALRLDHLRRYDALLLYANHDSITPDEERALMGYVEGGGGFVAVHSASFCFRNSPAFVAMVGAQFKSHDTATFTTTIVKPDHPVMRGLQPITTWDETYVHSQHNPDRVVLMERVQGDHHEPYTWVRNQGKGRVFYTALGHDERTWSNTGFQELLEHGIEWVVPDSARAAWSALKMPEPQYVDAALPNYEKKSPAPRMQRALSPEQSQKLIDIPPEFRLELFASEPDIVKPIAMAWDERGRLWIAETLDYPNTITRGPEGHDRIRILEDTDGDGRADKFTLFADSLNIPTGIVLVNGGVIVAQAPDFLFLKDTTGDDHADVRRVLMTGWGKNDTHAGPSNLQYAPDNHVWGSVGYAGFEGELNGAPAKFTQGFYRFHPDGGGFELLTRTSNNTWGLGFSETFDVFGSTANNAPSWFMAIPDRYLNGVRGVEGAPGSRGIANFYAMHPVANIRQVDVHGGYTAAAGHHLYTARDFPREYWNRVALINEPTGHLIERAIVTSKGAGFSTEDGWPLVAGADEWVSPVAAEVGPDGAVWFIDWYNFIVQHNPTPAGFTTGAGAAYETELRDHRRGRIYRIVYRDARAHPKRSLSKDDVPALLAALGDDNLFWRLTAQRLLVERGKRDVVPQLIALTRDASVDAIGISAAPFHALWTLHGLGALDGSDPSATAAAIAALRHPAAGVRKAAAQVLPRSAESGTALLESGVLRDPDLHTRLAAILALADMPASSTTGTRLYAMSREPQNYQDVWLSRAVYVAAAHHLDGFLSAYRADPTATPTSALPAVLRREPERPVEGDRATARDIAAWTKMKLPGRWEDQGYPDLDGVVWYTREVTGAHAGAALLSIPAVDDDDITWVNGVRVGATKGWDKPRRYQVPANVWKTGSNIIAVRVTDNGSGGGIWGEADSLRVVESDGSVIPLRGEWRFKIEKNTAKLATAYAQAGDLAAHVALSYAAPAAGEAPVAKSAPAATTLRLAVVPGRLAFDHPLLSARAGSDVEIVLTNPDQMQHNVVVGKPGSLERVGAAADSLAQTPGAAERDYVPSIAEVVASTKLADPGQSVRVRFRVPEQAGDYPFVCTFPGHWRVMRGVLRVTKR